MAEAARRLPHMQRPTWILAHAQTAARGRRGRAWASPQGNFSATLAMQAAGDPAGAALRSFVASLALYDTLAKVVAPGLLSLKWPNDVLLDGCKVAGILLEGASGPVAGWLTIGIGINLTVSPDAALLEKGAVPPTHLAKYAHAATPPERVLFELATAFARYEAQFSTFGFDPIRRAWLSRAARLGQPITARVGSKSQTGRFETVDTAGNLVLLTPEGRQRIAAADVYF